MLTIFIFSGIIVISLQKMFILQPQELQNHFSQYNQSIQFSIANFGHIPWGRNVIGTVILADPINACTAINLNTSDINERFIILVRRGNCTFVTKVRNSQFTGANLVIIVDNLFEETDKITMADDGYGSTIKIPSIFIKEEDGEIIENYIRSQQQLELQERQSVQIIIKFETNFWEVTYIVFALSLTNRESFKLIREFEPYYKVLKNEKVIFFIYFDYYMCYTCISKNFSVPSEDCLGGGRYCALDPDGEGIATVYKKYSFKFIKGVDIINEQLRSMCIFRNYPDLWFQYMQKFDENCLQAKEYQSCSFEQQKKVGIEFQVIQRCHTESFKEDLNIDHNLQENIMLEEQKIIKNNLGVRFFPGAAINNQTYLGSIEAEEIFGEICNSMMHPPEQCASYVDGLEIGKNNETNYVKIIIIIISIMVIFFLFMFVLYKITVGREMNPYINEKAQEMVNQYIHFYENKEKH